MKKQKHKKQNNKYWLAIFAATVLTSPNSSFAQYYFWNDTHLNCLPYSQPSQEGDTLEETLSKTIAAAAAGAVVDPGYCAPICELHATGDKIPSGRSDFPYVIPIGGTRSGGGPTCTYSMHDSVYVRIYVDEYRDRPVKCDFMPGYGNPIYPLTGAKRQTEQLGDPLLFGHLFISYDTKRKIYGNQFSAKSSPSFGFLWESSLHRKLVIQSGWDGVVQAIQASRGENSWISFSKDSSGQWKPADGSTDNLLQSSVGWSYYDSNQQAVETYDLTGRLLRIDRAIGGSIIYTYSTPDTPKERAPMSGLILSISDSFLRSIDFTYEAAPGNAVNRISSFQTGGMTTFFSYDGSSNLKKIVWPDSSSRIFSYDNPNLPWALTGIVDENSINYSTYKYDSHGLATETSLAGGVNKFAVAYAAAPYWNVTTSFDNATLLWHRVHRWLVPSGTNITGPMGQSMHLTAVDAAGIPQLTSQSQNAGAGCSASTSSQNFDANWNLAWKEDFNGHRACYSNDLSRNLEVSRVEGLAAGSSCNSVLPAGSSLPAGARKVTTAWHPVWRKEAKVAEPRRITTSVYNGQPDPLNGGATAWCAPSSALLPDGSPIVVLCKQVEQATTDVDGSKGFSATLSSTVAPRVQSWTYNQYGQVLTATDPLGHVTTSTYYPSTTADHTMGDLQSVTNAASQVTQYTKYNPMGQVLESIDPNGITTTYTYDLRQRLTSVSTAGATTSYAYWPTGLLKQVTLPETSIVAYGYDDAHRLTSVSDGLGNKISYTLDNTGVRIGESVEDPSGALTRSLSRVPDALGRIQQVTGQE